MTKREREQVVELLRCAADICVTNKDLWRESLSEAGHVPYPIWQRAFDAMVSATKSRATRAWKHLACLEAAQRIEEGSYP